jgi:hypothetical protein
MRDSPTPWQDTFPLFGWESFDPSSIQGFDVFQNAAKTDQAGPYFLGSQTVEHVNVIGIGAVCADNFGYRRAIQRPSIARLKPLAKE